MLASFGPSAIGSESEEVWAAVDAFYEISTPLEIPLRIVTAVVFFAWVHRASCNAHALSTVPLKHSTGASIGYWFVPIGNLWLPYQVVAEIERATAPEGRGETSGWVAAWWAAWVASQLGSRVVGADAEAVPAFALITAFFASSVLAMVVVERIRRDQIACAERSDVSALAAVFA
jgi:hypothetical protein